MKQSELKNKISKLTDYCAGYCKDCGKKLSKKKYSYCRGCAFLGERNNHWAGDRIGYGGIHDYIKRRLSKPLTCNNCKKATHLDLTNISQKYKRNTTDWEWLCRRCHMIRDGRLKTLPFINKDWRLKQKIEALRDWCSNCQQTDCLATATEEKIFKICKWAQQEAVLEERKRLSLK